jgi:hypothetical protein
MFPETVAPGPATRLPPAVPTDYIWRMSVDRYHEMIRGGILTDDDPVELLEGWLVTKMPKNPPHRVVTRLLRDRLEALAPGGWHINVQEPITFDESEPEPDLSAVRGKPLDYADRNPVAGDVGFLIEVSDSTLTRDRGLKKRIYARAGIRIYWIVNLVDRIVEIYTQPTGPVEQPDYNHRQDFGLEDAVPVTLDNKEIGRIAVREFLA